MAMADGGNGNGPGGSATSEWRRGWPVVVAAHLGMTLLGIFFFTAGVFFAPLEQEFGWTRAQVSLSTTIVAIAGMILSAPVGLILDRWGTRRMALFGVPLVGIAFALLSTLNGSKVQFIALWVALAILVQFTMVTVWSKAVANNFTKSRGLALSLAMMGNSVTILVAPQVANYLIEHQGWRTAYLVLGLGWGGLVTLTTFFMLHDGRNRPVDRAAIEQPQAELTGYAVREGLRSGAFIRLNSAAVICNILNIGFIVHLVEILTWGGVPRDTAVLIYSSLGIAMLAGSLTFGLVGDSLPAKWTTAFTVAGPAVSCLLLMQPGVSVWQGAAAVLFFGFVIGAQMPSYTYLSTLNLGMKSFGALQGFGNIAVSIATAVAPLIAARIYDTTHSYSTYLIAGVPLCVGAALILLTLSSKPRFAPATT
jgi:MFS family permease